MGTKKSDSSLRAGGRVG